MYLIVKMAYFAPIYSFFLPNGGTAIFLRYSYEVCLDMKGNHDEVK